MKDIKESNHNKHYVKSMLKTVTIILYNLSLSTLLYILKFTNSSGVNEFIKSILSVILVISVIMILSLYKVKSIDAINKKRLA